MGSVIRKRAYKILSAADHRDVPSRVFDISLASLILLNVATFMLTSVDALYAEYKDAFELIKNTSIIIFAIEYALRIWSCPDHPSGLYCKPVSGRLRYFFTPLMLMDLLAILPFFLGLPQTIDLRILRLFRLLSILRITHHSPALGILATVLKRESKTFIAVFMLIVVLLFFASTLIYYIERATQPDAFASIPKAMWWGMATLTTVGYGDVVPLSVAGKVFGVLVMFIGVGMFAIPTGILVTSFAQEIKRKDFVVTWKLVARVPSFSRLNALEIAHISDLLRLRTAMPNEIIFHRGDVADSMYFIVAGEVEVDLEKQAIQLKGGDFFGEVSLLYKQRRTATVRAKTFVELLQLDARDFETLLESNQVLREKITTEAEERITRS
jgi:voltage-gated potassium channel